MIITHSRLTGTLAHYCLCAMCTVHTLTDGGTDTSLPPWLHISLLEV